MIMNPTMQKFDGKLLWRVWLPMGLGQALGALAGLRFGFYYDPFLNLWVGLALIAPVGALMGLAWHLASPERRRAIPHFMIALIAGGSAAFLCGGAFMLHRMHLEVEWLDRMKNIAPAGITEIDVRDPGRNLIKHLNRPDVIAAFAEALRDAQGHLVNHDSPAAVWYLEIHGADNLSLKYYTLQNSPGVVILTTDRKEGGFIGQNAHLSSQALLGWLQKNIQQAAP